MLNVDSIRIYNEKHGKNLKALAYCEYRCNGCKEKIYLVEDNEWYWYFCKEGCFKERAK